MVGPYSETEMKILTMTETSQQRKEQDLMASLVLPVNSTKHFRMNRNPPQTLLKVRRGGNTS